MKILNPLTVNKVLGAKATDLKVVKSSGGGISVTTDKLPGVTVDIALENRGSSAINRNAIIDISGDEIVAVRNNDKGSSPISSATRGCLLSDVIR